MFASSTAAFNPAPYSFDFRSSGVGTATLAFVEDVVRSLPLAHCGAREVVRRKHATAPMWVVGELSVIADLPRDWDGYGAEPVSRDLIDRMGYVLESLVHRDAEPGSIVPGADGSLQVEWHRTDVSFGLLLEDCGSMSAWVRPAGGQEIEAHGLEAHDLFAAAVFTFLK